MKKSQKKAATPRRAKPAAKPQAPRMRKLLVISEGGRVIGTQVLVPPPRSARVTAVLQAGPRQQRHEIEIEVPPKLAAHEIHAFHEMIAGRLQLGK